MKINEENLVKVRTTVQGKNKTPYIYLVKALFENGLDVKPGQELDIYQDKKSRIIFFKYGQARDDTEQEG